MNQSHLRTVLTVVGRSSSRLALRMLILKVRVFMPQRTRKKLKDYCIARGCLEQQYCRKLCSAHYYQATKELALARQRRYRATEKGKETQRRYLRSPKGIACRKRVAKRQVAQKYHRRWYERAKARGYFDSVSFAQRLCYVRKIVKKRNKEWGLSDEEYKELINQPCYYCNNELAPPTKYSIGLDRLDNALGYVRDNVVSCCMACNAIRGEWLTFYEAVQIISYLVTLRRGYPK